MLPLEAANLQPRTLPLSYGVTTVCHLPSFAMFLFVEIVGVGRFELADLTVPNRARYQASLHPDTGEVVSVVPRFTKD